MTSPTKCLRNIADLFRVLSDLNTRMEISQAQVLMDIAINPGSTSAEIEKRTGLSQSAVSRNILALADWRKTGERGYNLIEKVKDPRETRREIVFLNAAGKAFIIKLMRNVSPSFEFEQDVTAADEVAKFHAQAAISRIK